MVAIIIHTVKFKASQHVNFHLPCLHFVFIIFQLLINENIMNKNYKKIFIKGKKEICLPCFELEVRQKKY